MSRRLLNRVREASDELIKYPDIKDWIVITVLSILTVGAIVAEIIFPNLGFNPLQVLTVVSVFFVYMQLRNQQSGSFPEYAKVVPHFYDEGELDREIFGLKNFGGPALNLRVYARVKTESGIFDAHIVPDYETVNVDNREFLPISTKELENEEQQKEDLSDPRSILYEKHQDSVLELFYTFESVSGRGHPSNLRNPTRKPMEDIVEMYDSKSNWKPKQVKLEEIRSRAVKEGDESRAGLQQENYS